MYANLDFVLELVIFPVWLCRLIQHFYILRGTENKLKCVSEQQLYKKKLYIICILKEKEKKKERKKEK